MAKQQLQTLRHCVFSLHYHLDLATKYRRKAITKGMLERLRAIFQDLNRIYWRPVFWHRSYCLISTGGTTIEILRKYIEEQGND